VRLLQLVQEILEAIKIKQNKRLSLATPSSESVRDEHGSGLDRTGSGPKPILAGSGLDRTTIFFTIGGSGLDRTEKMFVVLM